MKVRDVNLPASRKSGSGGKIASRKSGSSGKKTRLVMLAALLGLGVLFAFGRMIDIHHYIEALQTLVHNLGPWGGLGYVLIYVVAMLFLLPGTPFTIAAAFLFGSFWGFVIMLAASTLAAVVGFSAGRYFARDLIEKKLSDTEAFQKMKRIVEGNHRTAIPFIHVMPVFPFAVTNYAFGLTRVSLWAFLFYSIIVFIPMNAVLVLGARAVYMAAVQGQFSWGLVLGTAGAGVAILVLGWIVKKAVAPAQRTAAPPPAD